MKQKAPSLLLLYLREKVPYLEGLTVTGLFGLNDGWECEVYSFALGFMDKGLAQSRPMILRLYTGKDIPAMGLKAVQEFDTLRQLACDGYPVPQVYLLETEPTYLGSPFIIMEKLEGERLDCLYHRSATEQRYELLREMCNLLVRLNSIN